MQLACKAGRDRRYEVSKLNNDSRIRFLSAFPGAIRSWNWNRVPLAQEIVSEV